MAEIIAEAQGKITTKSGLALPLPSTKPITLGQLAGVENKIEAS